MGLVIVVNLNYEVNALARGKAERKHGVPAMMSYGEIPHSQDVHSNKCAFAAGNHDFGNLSHLDHYPIRKGNIYQVARGRKHAAPYADSSSAN